MSAQRFFAPAAAGATALGGYLYYNSQKPQKSRVEQRQERSQAKRDAGLGGAGVGQNAVTGLFEKGGPGSGVPTANTDPDRAVKTDAPREKLPSGGVGGGVGAGGANVRAIDINTKQPSYGDGAGASGSGGGSSSDGQNSSNKSTSNTSSSSSDRDTSTSSDGGTFGAGAGSSPDGQSSSRGSAKSGPAGGSPNSSSSTWSQGLQGIFGQGGASASDTPGSHRQYSDTKVHSNHADTPTKRFPGETVK